jgi:hypothetical protein
VPLPAMISVFKAVEWDNYGLITVDGGSRREVQHPGALW